MTGPYVATGFPSDSPLGNLERAYVGERDRNDFSTPFGKDSPQRGVQAVVQELDMPKSMSDGINFQFELQVRLFARFWANKSTLSMATDEAQHHIMSHLYRDVLRELDGISTAVMDGNQRDAYTRVSKLRRRLRGMDDAQG